MKNLFGTYLFIMLLLSAIAFNCGPSNKPITADPIIKTVVKDSLIYIPTFDYDLKDSMIDEMNLLKDSLFVERYKLERVKYYLKICKHNPSQIKFLVGWITRAVK